MKVVALIPARLASTRLPEKLLIKLGDKTVIQRTYEATVATQLFDEVIVVADSDILIENIAAINGKAIKSTGIYESGTDRIAEIAQDIEADVIINVQGDEPFVQKEPLAQLIQAFKEDDLLQVASIRKEITDSTLIQSPNIVKVITDLENRSLLFSRSPIPYVRDSEQSIHYYQHIGVYAFRKAALLQFTKWELTPLEKIEKIECLRFLEHGIPLKMITVKEMGIGIDVREDVERALNYIESQK